jgi:hypothetical protein
VTNVSLEEAAARHRAPHRDCRACAHFEPAEDGLAYGWCGVHEQFVKLYHPAGQFWSQCQFKFLARTDDGRQDGASTRPPAPRDREARR